MVALTFLPSRLMTVMEWRQRIAGWESPSRFRFHWR